MTTPLTGHTLVSPNPERPFVTLTFAQSLDGKIAGADKRMLPLSCNESMVMTHWLRTQHDGILIGIGTALNDNPQLNIRKLPPKGPSDRERNLPRPIVVDTHLRLSPNCKLLQNYRASQGLRPWIVTCACQDRAYNDRKAELEKGGARVIVVEKNADGRISINDMLAALRRQDILTLMIEGGAEIISTILQEHSRDGGLIDALIITLAPKIVGHHGTNYCMLPDCFNAFQLDRYESVRIGIDTVLTWRFDK